MTFLKEINSSKRTSIQLQAFLEINHLLLVNELLNVSEFNIENFEIGNKDISSLILKSLRFGKRLERFFEFAIEHHSDYKILANSIQVLNEKITIGELDFIIQDIRSLDIYHVEITNKFYLCDNKIENENNRWIGPNRNDSLTNKIEKLKNKQFLLLHNIHTQKKLTNLGIDCKNIIPKINFKAQLFLPLSEYEGISRSIAGFYVSKIEFENEKYNSHQYFLPEKHDWQVHPRYCENWFSYVDIKPEIELYLTKRKSPMIWMKVNEHKFEKIFIVWW